MNVGLADINLKGAERVAREIEASGGLGRPNEEYDMELTGIHHLTAISAAIRENHRFYTQTLGMRLVKRSVNQDDVSAYHLFYADAKGSPGTDLTFFDWPVSRERRGTRSIVRTCLRVNGEAALKWWTQRFDEFKVPHGDIFERDGRLTCDSKIPRVSGSHSWTTAVPVILRSPWDRSPVPKEHQIRGLGPIVISIPTLNPTDTLLTSVFNMRQVRDCPHPDNPGTRVHVFEMGSGGAACRAARRRAAGSACGTAGRRGRPSRGLPYARCELRRMGRQTERIRYSEQR